MSYREYLESDHWKALRIRAMRYHGIACALCGYESRSNDVHHVKYRNLTDCSVRDLRVLCRECHEMTHAVKTEERKTAFLQWKRTEKVVREARKPRNEVMESDFRALVSLFGAK